MDIFVDRSGVVMVRDCECGGHGPTSLWTDHDPAWRAAHRAEVMALLREQGLRPTLHTRRANADAQRQVGSEP